MDIQYDYAVLWEWISLAVRWLHVIAGIAWIGDSFYFIALDLGLRKNKNLNKGVHGEEWQVHGGGFYHVQKYLVAPDNLPKHLTWFKWESYTTWLSGFILLAIVYYAGAEIYLVDKNVMDLSSIQAIVISIASLAVGWVVYDTLCKSRLNKNDTTLMLILFVILVACAWGYTQVFSGRAAFIHLGALTATIMSANVFLVIMPNQKIVVDDLKAKRTPDKKYGIIAKQRSTHNNYLTLPVLFMMISNHYPLAFASQYNWVIAALIFLMGVTIRHYFNQINSRQGNPLWVWPVTAILFVAAAWLSSIKSEEPKNDFLGRTSNQTNLRFAENTHFQKVAVTIQGRCSMCHSAEPTWEGIVKAPKNILLETDEQIAQYALPIYLQAGKTNAMPPNNLSNMTQTERDIIVQWYNTTTKNEGS